MTTTEQAALVGRRMIFTGQTVAAAVTVLDVRTAFGRTDYQVRDCLDRVKWVSGDSCKAGDEGGEATTTDNN